MGIAVSQALRVAVSDLASGERKLGEAASHYVVRVHRLPIGATFMVFDPTAALEADATLLDQNARAARCRIGEPRRASKVGGLRVVLLQALGKGDKAESVIRDATALGVQAIELLETERSVPRPREARRERWLEIAVQAARQSGRGDVPVIGGPRPLGEALAGLDEAVRPRVVLSPDASATLLGTLEGWTGEARLALLVGPEGGLSSAELEQAERAGFRRSSFGPLVLRTETAATAALGALLGWAERTKDQP